MIRSILLAGAAASCLSPGGAAQAQNRDARSEAPPVPAPKEPAAEDIIVTGSPGAAQALAEIERVPGGVAVVPATAFADTPVQTIKDVLEYVPGVIVQSRMGDDVRLSIRGSGLSRAYGVRGITLMIDGIPLNTSDGLLDFFEVDPSAYRYVEVFKGANALRYGSNALGGAINLVTPMGRDAAPLAARLDVGSFGYVKAQASAGGLAGALDYFATASAQTIDGYRAHSNGNQLRGNLNLGYRIAPDLETRFYLYAASTRQRIPGEVGKQQALRAPRSANPAWELQDQQRNVRSIRIANRTTLQLGEAAVEFGAFYNNRHVRHPIFQWLDFTVDDYGGFVRVVDDRALAGLRNRVVLGANLQNGTIDTDQFVNLPGAVKGALVASMVDRSRNLSAFAEDSLHVLPDLTLIAGVQFQHARRERRDRFLSNGDQSGAKSYHLWSPRGGILWDIDADWQAFANLSRSAEVPTYDANSFASPANSDLRAQRATTYEIGTRGRRGGVGWDLSLYRATIADELQCLTTGPFSACSVINVDRTVHQGVEAGIDAAIPIPGLPAAHTFAVTAAYTWNDFRFDDDARYGSNRLPGVPEHAVRAEILYRHPRGGYAGPNVEWVPESYFADNASTLSVDAYALLNFKAGIDASGRWAAYVEARNLADTRYISTVAIAGTAAAGAEIFNPGTGRSVFGGVRVQW